MVNPIGMPGAPATNNFGMGAVSHHDMERLLEAVHELYATVDLAVLPAQIVSVLARLVPSEICTFNQIDTRENLLRCVHNHHSNEVERQFPWLMAHIHEHPGFIYLQETGDRSARKVSDFCSRTQFQRTALYNEFYRGFGIRYQMNVFLEGCTPVEIGLGLQRQA